MADINYILRAFQSPGRTPNVNAMLEYGRYIRDEWLWQYPILPEAFLTAQQMATQREWRVAGPARGVARAVEWLNNAITVGYDGIIEYGFEQFEKRRYADYTTLGRTIFIAPLEESGALRYVDPTRLRFQLSPHTRWYDGYTQEEFSIQETFIDHPIPLGANGLFIAPLAPIIPTAMLAWLIRQHDTAAADGRKIRDIIIVGSKQLAEELGSSIEKSLALWAGSDPTKNGVPITYVDNANVGTSQKVEDMIFRLGLANIPANFDRQSFTFEYVNEIAGAFGMSLRHFWNSERATNRALEEVQEARQAQKGPSSFVRTEQRLLNTEGVLSRFGRKIRFGYVEEVDSQSRESNARVLKLYAEGTEKFAKVFGNIIDGTSLLAWLQSEGILPPDIALESTEDHALSESDQLPIPTQEGQEMQSGQTVPSAIPEKSKSRKVDLDYDEIEMDSQGKITDRRRKVVTIEKIIQQEILNRPDLLANVLDSGRTMGFDEILRKAQQTNAEKFFELYRTEEEVPHSNKEMAKSVFVHKDNLTDEEHRFIFSVLDIQLQDNDDA